MGRLEATGRFAPATFLTSFGFSSVVLSGVLMSALRARYGFHNDFSFFTYDAHAYRWGFPETAHLVAIGRWLGALLLNLHFHLLSSLDGFTESRWVAVIVTAASAA